MIASNEPTRRLAAVLSADVEGYSRLCGLDEAGTVAMLNAHLKELIRPAVRSRKGRIVNVAGDGLLAEFASAVAATEAATLIQHEMVSRNKGVDPTRRIQFRIGVNLSEVIVEGRAIFGDGVNIAARAQSMAPAGTICITDIVHKQVQGKIDAEFKYLGAVELKNISEPVRLFQLLEAPFQGEDEQEGLRRLKKKANARPSIAVLPFEVLDANLDHRYFGDGFAEDLLTDLSRFRTISVVARESSFQYRGRQVDTRTVGAELGVRFLIEGSVRRRDQSIRVNVQLVNAETRAHIWANRFDVPLSNLFATQDEIVRKVIGALVPRLEEESIAQARRKPTEQWEAYDHYLKGKAALYSGSAYDRDGVTEARQHFERSIAIDPQFPYPYCFLVRLLNNISLVSAPGVDVAAYREQALKYARFAVSLDDADPHVHLALAWCYLWRGESSKARDQLELVEKLNPNDADRAMDRGTAWMFLGFVERAIEAMQHGIALNPHCPPSYLMDLAEVYFVSRRYEDMIHLLDRIPDHSLSLTAWSAAAHALAGDEKQARMVAARFVEDIGKVWQGKRGDGISHYADWVMDVSPFARSEDRNHLAEGLRLAGLPAQARNY